ncbi:MAG: response regulator [Magnetococcales bacterium]|nr:response regulator [Magnetococcales bacterium]
MAELLSKPKILIVDDQKSNIDFLSDILEDYDKRISLNGIKALEIARSANPPDLIIMDIMMPEMDGYEVCQRLKADKKTRNIPVIFVTAKKEVLDEKRGFELGAADYVTKPYHPDIIKHRINTHLELKKQYAELEYQERYIRSLFNYSLDPIISINANGGIVEFNQAAESTFGYRQQEISGKLITTLFAEPNELNFLDTIFSVKAEFKGEVYMTNKSGASFPASIKFAAVRNLDGNITGAVGSLTDLTAEKELFKLQQEERKVEAVKIAVETMKDVIRNSLHGLQLLRNEASSSVSKESLKAFDESVNNMLEHITKMEQLKSFSEIKIAGLKFFDIDGRYTKKTKQPETAKIDFAPNEIIPIIAYDSWDRMAVTPVVSKIAQFIASSNGEAFEHFKTLKELLCKTELTRELGDLENALDRFEFESAKRVLTTIAKRLNIQLDL